MRMMNWPLVLFMFVLFVALNGVRASNFCQLVVEPFGYGCAEYTVQTSDGFVLLMHRLSRIHGLIWSVRGSSPVVRTSPAFAPAPVQGDRVVSKYPAASGPSPVQGGPIVSRYPETIKDSTESRTVSSSAMTNTTASPVPAPEVFGNRNDSNVTHSNSTIAAHRGKRSHHRPREESYPVGAPITSTMSSNSTSSNSSLEQPVVAAGSAPISTQNASSSSTHRQRQSTTGIGSTSNYTANPLVRTDSNFRSSALLSSAEFCCRTLTRILLKKY